MTSIVGHRGARNLWPENSMLGFHNLCAMGVEAVEFDVNQSRDGEVFVIHDPTLERTTWGTGQISAKTARELDAIRLRDTVNEGVPRLDATLALFAPTPLELWIELKTDAFGNPYPAMAERVIAAIRRHVLEDRVILTSFVPESLEAVRQSWPKARVLASLDRRSAEMLGGFIPALERFAAIPQCIVAVEQTLLKPMLTPSLERLDASRLAVWVPNEQEDITFWLRQPVQYVVTDRPDLALAARATGNGEAVAATERRMR